MGQIPRLAAAERLVTIELSYYGSIRLFSREFRSCICWRAELHNLGIWLQGLNYQLQCDISLQSFPGGEDYSYLLKARTRVRIDLQLLGRNMEPRCTRGIGIKLLGHFCPLFLGQQLVKEAITPASFERPIIPLKLAPAEFKAPAGSELNFKSVILKELDRQQNRL
ncbi:Hypothetical_protein [Hexamita inflata]|uniref:Hypothetical_protein n=1 Tax=Hexamita inflata TaxID=28002 RepID=A0AA86UFM8_9EUKA|nr:Hypothetical protein HINF_LOCUS37037 [Hexamita inflata]